MSIAPRRTNAFILYALPDHDLLVDFTKHLAILERQCLIKVSSPGHVEAGQERDATAFAQLEAANLVLLLISPDFIDSEHYDGPLIQRILEKHRSQQTIAILVIIRPCDFRGAPFDILRVLPQGGMPITKWDNSDEAWTSVIHSIRAILERTGGVLIESPFEVIDNVVSPDRLVPGAVPGACTNRPHPNESLRREPTITPYSAPQRSIELPRVAKIGRDSTAHRIDDNEIFSAFPPRGTGNPSLRGGSQVKKWDVFISHASEDKQEVALPLANLLIHSGLNVWLDQFELRIGDSLREKIDEGLAESSFGVVILSEHFLSKGWPRRELNGLFSVEEDGAKVILPIWHGIGKAEVARYSPILADRLAANTSSGIAAVARKISQVIFDDLRVRPGRISLTKQFIDILDQGPSPALVAAFLVNHLESATRALDLFSRHSIYHIGPSLGGISPDLTLGSLVSTAGVWDWCHLFFCPANELSFEGDALVGPAAMSLQNWKKFLEWLSGHPDKVESALLPDHRSHERYAGKLSHYHRGIVVAGRRDQLSEHDVMRIRALRSNKIEIRSYDWIVDACAATDKRINAPKSLPLP